MQMQADIALHRPDQKVIKERFQAGADIDGERVGRKEQNQNCTRKGFHLRVIPT